MRNNLSASSALKPLAPVELAEVERPAPLDAPQALPSLPTREPLAAEGRDEVALDEHAQIVAAIEAGDGDAAYQALKSHISQAFETRLRVDAGELKMR